MSFWKKHALFEKSVGWLLIGSLIVVSIGGLVQIAPLFWLHSTIEKVDGIRPYTPLELAGRKIYQREGCYLCHSQMIRTLKDEVERYGHYSLAAESMYDHPFQWGSKRTGPDLARVGGKYSDAWHIDHLTDPRHVVPQSIMPPYAFMAERNLDTRLLKATMEAEVKVGVPYTPDMIKNYAKDLRAQVSPDDSDGVAALQKRYPKSVAHQFHEDSLVITEMDALIAYLQVLGTMVDFKSYDTAKPENMR